ncbi:hypothetical protein EC844_10371 [Acinetobacter calcoaceticus]|uniref:Uncharacterized protein n=1 Tax=Acinetobacter calcoaceticus TaxID=471 RepID=A0A4R1XYC2_ACICA|nr:hypothetical protein EC844_10371 [Acinetobacter calcoaceticus]
MTASRFNWQNIRLYSWLIGAMACLLGAVIFWAVTDVNELVVVSEPIEETQVQIQPEKVAATTNLGSLMNQVRPLEMTTRMVASGNHSPEFRGTKFIQDNAKSYTIELFRAADEEVITNFLRSQEQRKNFIYIRLSAENKAEQYVLAYGVYKQEVDLKSELTLLKLNLPASVQPHAVQLGQYAALVNDMGSEELSSSQQLYAVALKPAALPVIDETVLAQVKSTLNATIAANRNTTTRTTVTRQDAQGNVVDVQRSQTVEKPKDAPVNAPEKKAPPQEISDPFN